MRSLFSVILIFVSLQSFSQALAPDFWKIEMERRNQLMGKDSLYRSFNLRPSNFDSVTGPLIFELNPTFINGRITTGRPAGYGDYGMIPTPGGQFSMFSGISIKYKFLKLDLQPEFNLAGNRSFDGYSGFGESLDKDKFYFWNNSDYPERFGEGIYSRIGWGQTSLTAAFGSFETGISTKNIWWGPGQWNALIFSNNAPGFLHFTLRTRKPAKTFLGWFEGELISGKLNDSGFDAIQNSDLNSRFFKPFTGDWRYLNGITVSYTPKWIKGLSVGFSRTFQVYNDLMGNSFLDYFPIFEAFQKEKFFEDGNTVEFDNNGRDQQLSIFSRIMIPQAEAEFYFEFGKRDHNYNWREAVLNPEHARAYIFGFNKIWSVYLNDYRLQSRAEVVNQQESINRTIRYSPKGGLTWHTHTRARGFANLGQPLGVGLGLGSNSQKGEIAMVNGWNKFGISLERLANHQDFYFRAFGNQRERKPWVDYSLGLLFDKKFEKILLSSKLELIQAKNYQWQLDPTSTSDFPKGENLTSVMAQVSLVYFWNKSLLND